MNTHLKKRAWITVLALAGVAGVTTVWAHQDQKSPEQKKADNDKYAAQMIEDMHHKKLGDASADIYDTARLIRQQDEPSFVVNIAKDVADINDSVKIVTVLVQDNSDIPFVKRAEEAVQSAAGAKTLTTEQRDALKASAGSLQAKEALLTPTAK